MRTIVVIALACSLLGRASPAHVQGAPVQQSEYPNNLLLPSDEMSLVL